MSSASAVEAVEVIRLLTKEDGKIPDQSAR
jgi:hypothetical protein